VLDAAAGVSFLSVLYFARRDKGREDVDAVSANNRGK